MTQEIEIGSKVRIHANANDLCWAYGYIAEIKGEEALINYGTPQKPVYGMGIWMGINELEVLEV